MISPAKILAVFSKDAKALPYNRHILFGLAFVPALALMMRLITGSFSLPTAALIVMLNILVNGAGITSILIADEKESQTIGNLVSTGITGPHILIAKMMFGLLAALLVSLLLYFATGLFGAMPIGSYVLLAVVALLPAVVLGAIIGTISKTGHMATTIVAPLSAIFVMLPIVVRTGHDTIFASDLQGVWRWLALAFPWQLIAGFQKAYEGTSSTQSILVILANLAVVTIALVLMYRKKGL